MEAKIYNYKEWVDETEPEVLVQKLNSLLDDAAYKVLNFMEHAFEPQGYTCIWLLAESHLAVHTFPEQGRSYIELSSCSQQKNEVFVKGLQTWKKNADVRA